MGPVFRNQTVSGESCMRRFLSVAVVALCVVTMLFAKGTGGAPFTATFAVASGGTGVFSDNQGPYQNGVSGVKSYIGSGGKDYDLVTYSTTRYLTIVAPTSQSWTNSKLPQSGSYQVDFYGVNFYGPYSTMGPGTTAQVHGVLQFHYLGNTYQLDYQTLEVVRDPTNGAYHFSSIPGPWSPVPSSSNAMLSLVRKGGNVNYGTVVLPIQFDIQ
jgi:hypothetical protein